MVAAVAVVALLAACGPIRPDAGWNAGAPTPIRVTAPASHVFGAVASTPDGGTWAVVRRGIDGRTRLRRFTAAGQPDPTVGGGEGVVIPTVPAGPPGFAYSGMVVRWQLIGLPDGGAYLLAQHVDLSSIPLGFISGTTVRHVSPAGTFTTVWDRPDATAEAAADASGRLVVASQGVVERRTADGQPDTSFGGTGSVAPTGLDIRGLAVVGDEPVLIGSSAVVRLRADGTTRWTLPSLPVGTAALGSVAAGPGDTVVVATEYEPTPGRVLVLRITAAGTGDVTFAGDGRADIRFPTTTPALAVAERIAVDPAGRVLVTARAGGSGPFVGQVVRLHADGTPDATWADAGRLRLNGLSSARPPGRLLVGGHAPVATAAGVLLPVRRAGDPEGELVRYTPAGAVDTAFGTDGVIRFDEQVEQASSVHDVQSVPAGDGHDVFALVTSWQGTRVARLGEDGQPVAGWGDGGRSETVVGSRLALARLADGDLLVAGSDGSTSEPVRLQRVDAGTGAVTPWADVSVPTPPTPTSVNQLELRPLPDGGLVLAIILLPGGHQLVSLGPTGGVRARTPLSSGLAFGDIAAIGSDVVTLAFSGCPSACHATLTARRAATLGASPRFGGATVTLPDPTQRWANVSRLLPSTGALTIVGYTFPDAGGREAVVGRVDAQSGQLDLAFGAGGWVDTDLPPIADALVDQAGRTVLLHGAEAAPESLLSRLTATGALDTKATKDGTGVLDLSGTFARVTSVALDGDRRIVVGGEVGRTAAVLRLTSG